jgi:hypothetical protein
LDAEEIMQRMNGLRAARSPYESEWEDIARLMRPLAKGFGSRITPGQKRHKRIYHSGPLEAVENFKAGLYTALTPPATQWLQVQHIDEALNEYGPVKEYFDIVSERAWKSFGPGVSRFYNNVPAVYGNLGTFGTAVLYSEELEGQPRFIDRARSLAECYIDTDSEDQVDTLFRCFRLTARAIKNRPDWVTPPKVAAAADNAASAGQLFSIIHAVWPKSDSEKRASNSGMRWNSVYVLEEEKAILGSGGYYEFPFFVPRWDIAEGEAYGRGCGHIALADVKSLNIGRRSNLNMMDRAARPTLLAHSELDVGGGAAPYPGEIVYGAVNSDGKELIRVLQEGKNPAISLEMEKMILQAIMDTFKFGLMQIVGSYDMTATEWTGRAEEAQRLLGPYLGNSEVELLAPMVKRRVGMLERLGQLPPPPRELQEAGGSIEVKFVGMAQRLQRLKEGEAAVKTLQALQLAGAVAPDVLDRIDPDDTAEIIVDGFGSDILRTREIAQQIRDQREQQQQAMAMSEQAPKVGKAAKDITDAVVTAQAGGRPPAPQAA